MPQVQLQNKPKRTLDDLIFELQGKEKPRIKNPQKRSLDDLIINGLPAPQEKPAFSPVDIEEIVKKAGQVFDISQKENLPVTDIENNFELFDPVEPPAIDWEQWRYKKQEAEQAQKFTENINYDLMRGLISKEAAEAELPGITTREKGLSYKERRIQEIQDDIESLPKPLKVAYDILQRRANRFNIAGFVGRISPLETDLYIEVANRHFAQESGKSLFNWYRVLDLPANIAGTLLDFSLLDGVPAKIAGFSTLPKVAQSIIGTSMKFGLQSALQLPAEGETVGGRMKEVAISTTTGAGVGTAGQFIPNPFIRIPVLTGGFAGLTALEGGDTNQVLESAAAILGFEALGILKQVPSMLENRQINKAIENARKYNPALAEIPDETLKYVLENAKEIRWWEDQYKKNRISKETKDFRVERQAEKIRPVVVAIAKEISKTKPVQKTAAVPPAAVGEKTEAKVTPKETIAKKIKKEAVQILPRKDEILAQLDEALKNAPSEVELRKQVEKKYPEIKRTVKSGELESEAYYEKVSERAEKISEEISKQKEGDKLHFEIDGGINVYNTKEALQFVRDRVKATPKTEIIRGATTGTIRVGTPSIHEDLTGLYPSKAKGIFGNGRILIKGTPPASAKVQTHYINSLGGRAEQRPITQEIADNILNSQTQPVKLQGYSYIDPEYGELLSKRPLAISRKDNYNVTDESKFPIAVFKDDAGKVFTFNQYMLNSITKRFPKANYGINSSEILIAYENNKPVAALAQIEAKNKAEISARLDTIEGQTKLPETKPPKIEGEEEALEAFPANKAPYNEIDFARLQVSVDKEKGIKPISANQILEATRAEFPDVPIRDMATHRPRNKLGYFFPKVRGIRLLKLEQLTTLFHEIGHSIDSREKKITKKPPNTAMRGELLTLGKALYGSIKPVGGYASEGWAEFIRLFVTAEDAQTKAPATYDWFVNKYLPKNPELDKKLNRLRDLTIRYRMQGAEERIEQKRTEPKAAFKDVFDRMILNLKTDWLDEFQPFKEYMEKSGIDISKLEPVKNPIELARAYAAKSSNKTAFFALVGTTDMAGNITGLSLKEVLKPIADDIENFTNWAYAAQTLQEQKLGIDTGISITDATYVYEKYDSPLYQKVLADFTRWNRASLDYLVEAEAIPAELRDKLVEKRKIYFPLFRQFKEGETKQISGGAGKGFTKTGQPVKTRKGSDRPFVDMIEASLQNMERSISIAQKIRIVRTLANFAGQEGTARLIWKVPAPIESKEFVAEKIKKQIIELAQEKLGLSIEDMDIEGLKEEWDDLISVFLNAGTYKGKNNIISIKDKEGHKNWYEVEPELFEVLEGIDPYYLPPILDWVLGKPTRLVKLGATGLNAAFGLVRNPIRDIGTSVVLAKHSKTPIPALKGIAQDTLNDLAKIGKNFGIDLPISDKAQLFEALGGTMSSQIIYDKRGRKHLRNTVLASNGKRWIIHTVLHPLEALREIIGITESGVRNGEFDKALEYGEKLYGKDTENARIYALNQAQDVTLNFTMRGKNAKRWNEVIPFFNAGIRGIEKVYRTVKERPFEVIIRGVAYLTIPAILLWWKNKDKDWYKKLADYEKFNYEHIEIPGTDTIVRWPRPFETGYIFQSIPTTILDAWYNDNPKEVKAVFEQFVINANPLDWPAALRPVIDIKANEDFAGRPIIPRGEEGKLPEDIFGRRTPEHSKETLRLLAKALNKVIGTELTPAEIEYIANSYTGGIYGRTNELLRMTEEEKTESDWPIIGTLFLRESYAPRKQTEEFYGERDRLEQTYRSMQLEMPAEDLIKRSIYNKFSLLLGEQWKLLLGAKTEDEKKTIYKKIEVYIKMTEQLTKGRV